MRPERLRTGSRAHPGSRPEKGGGASCPACSCGSPASRGPDSGSFARCFGPGVCPGCLSSGTDVQTGGSSPPGGQGLRPGQPGRRQGGAAFSATLAVRFFTRQVCVLEAGRAATLNVKRGPSAPRRCRGAARGLGSPDAVSLDDVGTASTFAQPLPRGNSEWAPEEATGRGRGKARAGNGERGIPSTQNWSFLRQGSSGVSSRECRR